ncbi:O-antigen ligase family protein [Vibrio vulnificus]|uniref:O-antigen ligase family protein n=1 Tax=Vibrio vulnificus TaxID=672 RepID=UPI0005F22F95|nr:O-antigen ligase family protein [Vibrio vulnificus]
MNLSIKTVSKSCVVFSLALFPFWEVLTAQTIKLSGVFGPVMGFVKYAILILPLIFSLAYANPKLQRVKVLYITYIVYLLLHFIGDSGVYLYLESSRFLILYPLVFILLYSFMEDIFDIHYNIILKIFLLQFLFVSLMAIFEFFDQSILVFLYGKQLQDIPHITWFSGVRLISVIGNPINLGAVLLILFTFVYFDCGFKSNVIKIALLILLSFPVLFTLSRMSTLLLGVLMTFLISREFRNNNLFFSIVLILSVFLFIYLIFTSDIISDAIDIFVKRTENIFNPSEYTENLRVQHWNEALTRFDNVIYVFWGLGGGSSNPSEIMRDSFGSLIIENSFISQFVDYGIIGLIMYISIFCRVIYLGLFFCRKTTYVGPLIAMTLLLFFSFTNDYHRNLPFSLWFWFLIFYLERFKNNFRV